ncbi:TIGR02147 family protein [Bdellovibrio sp. HCB209]|uniref:TIGR02147 family protein n=1 Tax=Bdellovibrio sp. HCB209 TaxID=3394354 RepID=UPI0039B4259F
MSKNSNLEQFREVLQREFLERNKINPTYSLRSYAKSLGIDQSFLSKVLKGSRPVTAQLVDKLGPILKIKPTDLQNLFTEGTTSMPSFASMSDDEFEHLSDWHHSAILALVATKDFDLNHVKIANRLGIHVEEVRATLSRLERLGCIEIADGKIKVLKTDTPLTGITAFTEARKQLQKKLISKSLEALEDVPQELRQNGSLTVAVSKKRLPELKEKLNLIQKELAEFLQASNHDEADEVYQVTLALFPLTKNPR